MQLYQVGAPMEHTAVDIAGPLPVTTAGNCYICVAMDYFTKWPEAHVLPNHEAMTVAGVLVEQYFTRFGMLGELHSDQGLEFESAVFQECCQLLGLRKTRTTPLWSQSDSMVEKFNWMLTQELAKYCGEDRPSCPPDEELPTVSTDYAVALQEHLALAHFQVRHNLRFAGSFAEGDLVWLHNPRRKRGLSPKLQSSWEGPYTVVEPISEVTYRITRGSHCQLRIVHINRMWRYYGPGQYTWGPGGDDGKDKEVSGHEELQEDEEDAAAGTGGDDEMDEMQETYAAGAEEQSVLSPSIQTSNPRRRVKRPQRFEDYVMSSEEEL
ncbi:uncharacterized protein LOC135116311 [Scylla paramamosain]|uniref:uncharacterized protein LOC135116311 n=1 Tax=Scylla paramamosain TaxID=85552 RepID=UPI003082C3CF